MKKEAYIVTMLFLIIFTDKTLSQTHQLNQQKYWYYRNRLLEKFMFIDIFNPYENGSGLPASTYNSVKKKLRWGSDATIHLATYMQALATEYALLSYYGYSTEKTKRDLFFAIETFVRLDLNAEQWFRYPHTKNGKNDGNGFFIRDDVDNNYIYEHWYYFNSDIYYDWNIESLLSQYINIDNGQPEKKKEKLRVQMSKDQCWHLYTAFALITKLMDGVTIQDSKGNVYSFSERVKLLTNNIQYQLSGTSYTSTIPIILDWKIRNPVNGLEIEERMGGKVWTHAYGFGIAGSFITNSNLHTKGSQSDYARIVFLDAWQWDDWEGDDYSERALSTVGDIRNYNDFAELFEETDRKNVYSYPHFPLIHLILHPELYGPKERILANSLLKEIKKHLDEAPMEGPNYDAPVFWTSPNTIVWPEQRKNNSDFNGEPGDEYNGIDYMLLHNLYYLAKKELINLETQTMPIQAHTNYGIKTKPITIEGKNITFDKNIGATADVSFISGSWITLERGFEAPVGSNFYSNIDNYSYYPPPSSNLKSSINYELPIEKALSVYGKIEF